MLLGPGLVPKRGLFSIQQPRSRLSFSETIKRFASSASPTTAISRTRNIGIIAHVDAGKTTTCERILYYSGTIKHAGDIDEGNTTMDYMAVERERGITIKSAAITFNWRDHKINLIDTPGHVDFTYEVERSVRVLDGAVVILDAVAGVQAQSETVWRQAERYEVPRICYVNKMDREGASFSNVLESISNKFGVLPIPIQTPYFSSGQFLGVVDLINMKLLEWTNTGMTHSESDIPPEEAQLYSSAIDARTSLLENLANLDDTFLEHMLNDSGASDINPDNISKIQAALKRVCHDRKGLIVTCGSSYKYKAVQPMMDAIIRYLPSPLEKKPAEGLGEDGSSVQVKCNPNDRMVALAFKVVHDFQRGLVVYVRVYSGVLKAGLQVYNATQKLKERALRVLHIHANANFDVSEVHAGDIAALVGLKHVKTGDTLLSIDKHQPILLKGVKTPPPVFFCAVEGASLSEQKLLDESLGFLNKEDPSFSVMSSSETGQTTIGGMGELHLQILKRRLEEHYKVSCQMGKPRISYRATFPTSVQKKCVHSFSSSTGKTSFVEVDILIEPGELKSGIIFTAKEPKDYQLPPSDGNRVLEAIRQGVMNGAESGVEFGVPLTDLSISLLSIGSSDNSCDAFQICASKAVIEAARETAVKYLQPIMQAEIIIPEQYYSVVTSDLRGVRNGIISSVSAVGTGDAKMIKVALPLRDSRDLSTVLRSLTRGSVEFSMEFLHYGDISPSALDSVMGDIRGF